MAAAGRTEADSLRAMLQEEPQRFEFFQAVRLLERIYRGRQPIGRDGDPRQEIVRFRSGTKFGFPASEIEALSEPAADGGEAGPLEMRVSFFGIATPSSFGSLPLAYTQQLRAEVQEGRTQLRDFLDIFNHRLVSFFYRAWEKYQLPIGYEAGPSSAVENLLFSLIGFGTEGLRGRLPFQDTALLARSGLLGRTPMSAISLERMLESYFQVAVRVEQFRARTYTVETEDLSRLGVENSTLGVDCCLGDQVTLCDSSFRVQVGPLDWDTYLNFLPSGEAFEALAALTRIAVGSELDFEVQPVLARAEAQDIFLDTASDRTSRLGWSSLLKSTELEEDVLDAVFDASAPKSNT